MISTKRTAEDVRAALDAVRRIVQALRLGASAVEQRAGFSAAQLFALQQIAEHPGASINDVAALTFTHQSSVSVVIQRLVSSRLVVKIPARHDRRRQHLELTAAGRRVLRASPAVVQQRLIEAIAALDPVERRRLARLLTGVAARMASPRAAAHPPMLFEETAARRRVRRGGRGATAPRGRGR